MKDANIPKGKDLKQNFALTATEVADFKRKGYLRLKNIFDSNFVNYLKSNVEVLSAKPVDRYGSDFERFKYDILNDDPRVLDLVTSKEFASILHPIVEEDLVYTQGISFELRKNVSTGFPWHVGTQSFGFQHQKDFGITIWIPLVPIKAKENGGGMAYVSKDVLSGEFIYQHINALPEYVSQKTEDKSSEDALEFFLDTKNSLLNSGHLHSLLEHFAEEDDFDLGDAFIFDKYVMHRSVPLFGGEHDVRAAFVLRFTGASATYDLERVKNLSFARQNFNYSGSSAFNEEVCVEDGSLICESELLQDVSDRLVKFV